MLFNSYIFILLFLPLTLIGYNIFNNLKKYEIAKFWLLSSSLVFYAYFNISYLWLMLFSIIFNFSINKILNTVQTKTIRRLFLVVAIFANIGILFYYKYFDFFVSNINTLFSLDYNLRHLILPLGISFFTFQQLSYIIDSYKREVPKYNFLEYALFVTFFPQLIAGPIVSYDEIIPQFVDKSKKKFNYENFSKGLMALGFGLFKKVIIADTFGNAVNWGYGGINQLDSTNAILVMLAYTIQIYFDFSGYCDMATGIGLMFNIDIPMNFNSPYKSLTILEFWKRWHITLTRFFTKYIYIPLGGSRNGNVRTYVNVFIVFLASGIWHGANWTFILWGVLHGVASIINRIFAKQINKNFKVINWLITFSFVNITWIYFRADSISLANKFIKNILRFNFGNINQNLTDCFNLTEFMRIAQILNIEFVLNYIPNLFLILFFAFAIFAILKMKNTNERINTFKQSVKTSLITVFMILWSVVSFSGISTFLYFNF